MAQFVQGGAEGYRSAAAAGAIRARRPFRVVAPVELWAADDQISRVIMHVLSVGNVLCDISDGKATCAECSERRPRKWENWLYAQDLRCRYAPQLLRLTDGALASCPALVEPGRLLWGGRLRLWRKPQTIMGAMFATLAYAEDVPALWKHPTVLDSLRLMSRALRAVPPAPGPRVYVPPAAGEGGADAAR